MLGERWRAGIILQAMAAETNAPLVSVAQYMNRGEAEILRGLLEAQGIQVSLSQEAVGSSVFPVDVGAFGQVEVLVPPDQAERARKVMRGLRAGGGTRRSPAPR